VDPSNYQVHREEARFQDVVVSILDNGDPAHKVDLLIMGDGYTRDEQDVFIARARELADLLFSTSPFKERRSDFNVWALAPPAAESGVSRPSTGTYRDSPLGTAYDVFGSERYVLTFDNANFRRAASSAPYEFVEIITNSETYGGGGIFGLYGTVAANSEWAPYVFVHEFGHHFAGLADEYYTSSVAYEPPATIIEPYEPNVTIETNAGELKWRDLVTGQTPVPTPWPKQTFEKHSRAVQAERAELRATKAPEARMNQLFRDEQSWVKELFSDTPYPSAVGLFEGANYQAEGYYRSQQNCIMFTRTEHFCAVCAAAIHDIIDAYSKGSE
jgi:hypothetical protein